MIGIANDLTPHYWERWALHYPSHHCHLIFNRQQTHSLLLDKVCFSAFGISFCTIIHSQPPSSNYKHFCNNQHESLPHHHHPLSTSTITIIIQILISDQPAQNSTAREIQQLKLAQPVCSRFRWRSLKMIENDYFAGKDDSEHDHVLSNDENKQTIQILTTTTHQLFLQGFNTGVLLYNLTRFKIMKLLLLLIF